MADDTPSTTHNYEGEQLAFCDICGADWDYGKCDRVIHDRFIKEKEEEKKQEEEKKKLVFVNFLRFF
jgi:hypothetical protein